MFKLFMCDHLGLNNRHARVNVLSKCYVQNIAVLDCRYMSLPQIAKLLLKRLFFSLDSSQFLCRCAHFLE